MRMDGQTDGRTDGRKDMTNLIVLFRNFANAPENQNNKDPQQFIKQILVIT
jgi:hypothetical protein